MLKSLSLSFALVCCALPALANNVLVNSDFETGLLPPWTNDNDFCGGCTWSVDSADAHSGTYSAVVDGNRLILQTFLADPGIVDLGAQFLGPSSQLAERRRNGSLARVFG